LGSGLGPGLFFTVWVLLDVMMGITSNNKNNFVQKKYNLIHFMVDRSKVRTYQFINDFMKLIFKFLFELLN
jgi:hypothetical protein